MLRERTTRKLELNIFCRGRGFTGEKNDAWYVHTDMNIIFAETFCGGITVLPGQKKKSRKSRVTTAWNDRNKSYRADSRPRSQKLKPTSMTKQRPPSRDCRRNAVRPYARTHRVQLDPALGVAVGGRRRAKRVAHDHVPAVPVGVRLALVRPQQ